jgi:hypothetical protein
MALPSAESKNSIEIAYQVTWQGDLSDNAMLAALEGFDDDDAAFNIDRFRGEGEHLGNPAAAPSQCEAEKPNVGWRALGSPDETAPFGGVEIFSFTAASIEGRRRVETSGHWHLG